jgi:UDP-N-acetyl-D-galactosamine dehydrogenase
MNYKIGIIGLGYVGLPLALEFSKFFNVIGFDINKTRINELLRGIDNTKEVDQNVLLTLLKNNRIENKASLNFTSDINDLQTCNVYIITVPTPINKDKSPNLIPILTASKMVSSLLMKNDIVIFESTVYPGCTEEDCVPVLEKGSGLIFNKDFYCGYSPERINPGDKEKTLTKIVKITSGSDKQTSINVDNLYKTIIEVGTFLAPSIKVAEAAKIIENCQRDLNISFMNELALIFDKMGLDTSEVLEAAGTKFNFLKFKPGLVGGHCISVDPYYLTAKSESLGYYPEVIHSGRRINDNMAIFISNKVIKLMIQKNIKINGSKVLILGITFKENCPDLRNSKVIEIINELTSFGVQITVFDDNVDPEFVFNEYNFKNITSIKDILSDNYDAIILAVAHDTFKTIDIKSMLKNNGIIYDIKSFLPRNIVDARL